MSRSEFIRFDSAESLLVKKEADLSRSLRRRGTLPPLAADDFKFPIRSPCELAPAHSTSLTDPEDVLSNALFLRQIRSLTFRYSHTNIAYLCDCIYIYNQEKDEIKLSEIRDFNSFLILGVKVYFKSSLYIYNYMYDFKGKILLLTNCNIFYRRLINLTFAKIDFILMKISGGGSDTNYSMSP